MQWQGLLTDSQHRAGYGTTMDKDFIWLWHGENSPAQCVAMFPYEYTTIKQVRDAVDQDMKVRN